MTGRRTGRIRGRRGPSGTGGTSMLQIAVPMIRQGKTAGYYLDALIQSGAKPVTGSEIDPERCSGLLLPGGPDVEPVRYGQQPAPETKPDPELDALQFDVLERFLALGRPVFGICRGQQLINAALGGTLIQHLPTAADHIGLPDGTDNAHACTADPDSFIGRLYGPRFAVNSSHHQAVDRPGAGLRPVLWAQDGVIEALQHETLPIWSVQFHPERMGFARKREDTADGRLLFRFFLEKCREANQ